MTKESFELVDESYLQITKWKKINPKLTVGFSTRNGGFSEAEFDSLNLGLHVNDDQQKVVKNREHLAKALNIPLSQWVCAEQVHDVKIKVVTKADTEKGVRNVDTALAGIDGLITKENNLLCTAFFADCVPLLFFDERLNYVGVAHAGWKGTVKEMARHMVEKFLELGSEIENIRVAIGPCISQKNYEVNDHVMQHVDKTLIEKVAQKTAHNKYMLDLKQLNVEILLQNGILSHNIEVTSYCTYENEDLFYSFRRDHGKTGRMLAFISISDE